MIRQLTSVLTLPDLRRRVLVTFALLAVYRIGWFVPTPGIDMAKMREWIQVVGGAFELMTLFSGGQFNDLSVFALGLAPYVMAASLVQILAFFWPYLRRLSRQGDPTRCMIRRRTRYLAIVLAILQSAGVAAGLQASELVLNPGAGFLLMAVVTLTMGAALAIWLGDHITEHGIGNGMTLILVTDILGGLPSAVYSIYENIFVTATWNLFEAQPFLPAYRVVSVVLILGGLLAVVALVVLVERSGLRIPVRYVRHGDGRRAIGSRLSYLPLRLSAGGVIPIAFASSILAFPQSMSLAYQDSPRLVAMLETLSFGEPLYELLYAAVIVICVFFYSAIVFNPDAMAENLQKHNGSIPGIEPGKPTAEYIGEYLTRAALVGGLYLALISVIPDLLIAGVRLHHLPWVGDWADSNLPSWFLDGLNINFYFGGASLIVVVRVVMDTVDQIKAQIVMGPHKPGSIEGESSTSAGRHQAGLRRDTVEYERFVPVATMGDAAIVPLAESLLISADIRYVVANDAAQDLFGWGRLGTRFNVFTGPPTMCVEPSRAKEAVELLSGIETDHSRASSLTACPTMDKPAP